MTLNDIRSERQIKGLMVIHPEENRPVELVSCFGTPNGFGFWYKVNPKDNDVMTFYVDSLDDVKIWEEG